MDISELMEVSTGKHEAYVEHASASSKQIANWIRVIDSKTMIRQWSGAEARFERRTVLLSRYPGNNQMTAELSPGRKR